MASAAHAIVPVTFAPEATYPTGTGSAPRAVAVADFNGDSLPDIAVAGSGSVQIFPGLGNGTFGAAAAALTTSGVPSAIVAGDLTNDDRPDLVVANATAGTLSVFVSTGSGFGFQPAITVTLSGSAPAPSGLVLGRFDADDLLDLAVANAGANRADVLLGVGNGTFTASDPLIFQPHPTAIASADLDHDGHLDLVLARREITGAGTAAIFLGGADGSLFRGFGAVGAISQPTGIAAADVNDDGAPDLILTGGDANRMVVLTGNGDGTFNPPVGYTVGNAPQALAVADINGDGVPDIATVNQGDGSVTTLLGSGLGSFRPAQVFGVGQQPQAIAVADLNGDLYPDIVTANSGDDSVSVLLNLTGVVTPPPTPTTVPGPLIAIGSAQGDAGQSVAIAVSLQPNGTGVVGVQNDIAFDPSRFGLNPNHCTINPALDKQLSRNVIAQDATHAILRAIVLSLADVSAIPAGLLYTCTFDILASTLPGNYALSARGAIASDATGDAIAEVNATDGAILVNGATVTPSNTPTPSRTPTRSPTSTVTATKPTATMTATATATATPSFTSTGNPSPSVTETVTVSPPPIATVTPSPSTTPTTTTSPTATATATASESPTALATATATAMRAACVGDCDGNGTVSVDELVLAVNISLGNADVALCRAADADMSNRVSVDELVQCVNNSLNGCPG